MVNDPLIAGCIRQEPRAQYELYRALYPMMMSICSRYERNRQDAAATMNQGFLKILDNLGQRRPEVPFEAWSRRIMINTVIDVYRKDKPQREREKAIAPADEEHAVDVNGYLERMEGEAFAELLMRVPPMSRTVFNLYAIDGYAHTEIAEMIGISEGTSKWHVSNARSVLRAAIAREAEVHTRHTAHR